MAIRLIDRYPNRADPATSQYPHGKGRNKSDPTADDGTPFDEDRFNDYEAFFQGILEAAGITPSGTVDTVPVSDYLSALVAVAHGFTEVDVASGSNVTIDANQKRVAGLRMTGDPGGDVEIIVPDTERVYLLLNETSGGHAVTVKTQSGSGVSVGSQGMSIARCDGANVVLELLPSIDEDNMASDSPSAVPTQQSVRRYVDGRPGEIEAILRTSVIENGFFADGLKGWGTELATGSNFILGRSLFENSIKWISQHNVAQINHTSGESPCTLQAQNPWVVNDNDGAFFFCFYRGADPATPTIKCFDDGGNALSDVVLSNVGTSAGWNAYFERINPSGGASPAWPAGTAYAYFTLDGTTMSGGNGFVTAVFLCQNARLPLSTSATAFDLNSLGGGTHEAAWDGTHLFVVTSQWSEIAKMDAEFNLVDTVTTAEKCHDIVAEGDNLWVVTQNGQTIEQIDKTNMMQTGQWTITGPREGFGVEFYNGKVYIGAGNSSNAETPAIIEFDPSDDSQTVLSTDVDGGAANVPIVQLDGDLWCINSPDGNTTEVKRIDTAGTTVATVTTGLGKIYGLGTDGDYLYATGVFGISKIDPDTNAIDLEKRFTRLNYAGTNLKAHNGRIWGGTQNAAGFFYYDVARDILVERPGYVGSPKWVEPMNENMAAGLLATPEIYLLTT